LSKEKTAKHFIAVGIIIFIVAFIVWLYPAITIASINGKLEMLKLKGSLTDAEKQLQTNLQYKLAWWEMMQATLFHPLAMILIIIAVAIIIYGVVSKYLT